jgi:hypothetical protein
MLLSIYEFDENRGREGRASLNRREKNSIDIGVIKQCDILNVKNALVSYMYTWFCNGICSIVRQILLYLFLIDVLNPPFFSGDNFRKCSA